MPNHSAGQFINQMSRNTDWYTPYWILRLVRQVLGTIDLDPASNFKANINVKAKIFYTKQDDGLQHAWYGKIFCNPPYGRVDMKHGYVTEFIKKAIQEYQLGHMTEGILLVPVNLSSSGFWAVFGVYPLCFIKLQGGKVKFMREDDTLEVAHLLGTMLVYFGNNRDLFRDVFLAYGAVLFPECIQMEKAHG